MKLEHIACREILAKTARRASRTTPSGKGRSTSRETLCLVSDPLTAREREVLALLCEGLPNKLIARHLKISSGTVKVHISNIFRALNVSNRLQAVLIARCWGCHASRPSGSMLRRPLRQSHVDYLTGRVYRGLQEDRAMTLHERQRELEALELDEEIIASIVCEIDTPRLQLLADAIKSELRRRYDGKPLDRLKFH